MTNYNDYSFRSPSQLKTIAPQDKTQNTIYSRKYKIIKDTDTPTGRALNKNQRMLAKDTMFDAQNESTKSTMKALKIPKDNNEIVKSKEMIDIELNKKEKEMRILELDKVKEVLEDKINTSKEKNAKLNVELNEVEHELEENANNAEKMNEIFVKIDEIGKDIKKIAEEIENDENQLKEFQQQLQEVQRQLNDIKKQESELYQHGKAITQDEYRQAEQDDSIETLEKNPRTKILNDVQKNLDVVAETVAEAEEIQIPENLVQNASPKDAETAIEAGKRVAAKLAQNKDGTNNVKVFVIDKNNELYSQDVKSPQNGEKNKKLEGDLAILEDDGKTVEVVTRNPNIKKGDKLPMRNKDGTIRGYFIVGRVTLLSEDQHNIFHFVLDHQIRHPAPLNFVVSPVRIASQSDRKHSESTLSLNDEKLRFERDDSTPDRSVSSAQVKEQPKSKKTDVVQIQRQIRAIALKIEQLKERAQSSKDTQKQDKIDRINQKENIKTENLGEDHRKDVIKDWEEANEFKRMFYNETFLKILAKIDGTIELVKPIRKNIVEIVRLIDSFTGNPQERKFVNEVISEMVAVLKAVGVYAVPGKNKQTVVKQ